MSIDKIDVWGEPVGLVAEIAGGFRFFAADRRTRAIDGRVFPSIGHARLAAIRATRATEGAPPGAPFSISSLAAAARSLDRVPV